MAISTTSGTSGATSTQATFDSGEERNADIQEQTNKILDSQAEQNLLLKEQEAANQIAGRVAKLNISW